MKKCLVYISSCIKLSQHIQVSEINHIIQASKKHGLIIKKEVSISNVYIFDKKNLLIEITFCVL